MARVDGGERQRRPDLVAVEEPLAIQLDGPLVTTTMRTPGHDFELAAGFCFAEGLLDGAAGASLPLLRHGYRRARPSSTWSAWRPVARPPTRPPAWAYHLVVRCVRNGVD